MVNFPAGKTLDKSTVTGGSVTPIEAFETPGVEIPSPDWRCMEVAPYDVAKPTNNPKDHPVLHGELTDENFLLGNKEGGTSISVDKVPGRM